MPFFAQPGQKIKINNKDFKFTFHPSAKNMAYAQSARRSTVYQVENESARFYALKIFNKMFRDPYIASSAVKLKEYASLPGFEVCQRYVITGGTNPGLVESYPDFQYAVLMPWIEGQIWQSFIIGNQLITKEDCKTFARAFIHSMYELEKKHSAHCDISGANVMMNLHSKRVILIDVEEMFGPGLEKPKRLPAGTPGYAHREVQQGVWQLTGDRFAGAVLIAEILGWHDARVRRIKSGESYFSPNEMQQSCDRYNILLKSLTENWGGDVADLFSRTWFSQSLNDCPTFKTWDECINQHSSRGREITQQISLDLHSPKPQHGVFEKPQEQINKVKSLLQELVNQGSWGQARELCQKTLSVYPEEKEIAAIYSRCEKIFEMEADLQKAIISAEKLEDAESWKSVIKLTRAMKLVEPDIKRYDETHDDAQQRLEQIKQYTLAQQLLEKGDYAEALGILNHLPTSFTKAARLRIEIEYQMEVEKDSKRIREDIIKAAKINDFNTVLLRGNKYLIAHPEDDEIKVLINQAKIDAQKMEKVVKLRHDFHEAIITSEWQKAINYADQILAIIPQDFETETQRGKIVSLIKTKEKLTEAKIEAERFNWYAVESILADLADDSMEVKQLKQQAMQLGAWRKDAETAKAEFNVQAVKALLIQTPASNDELIALKDWYDMELKRRADITSAIANYDMPLLQGILQEIPDNYPNRANIENWVAQESGQFDALEKAKAKFNVDEMVELLDHYPNGHPIKTRYLKWVNEVCQLVSTIEKRLEDYDATDYTQVIQALDKKHPKHGYYLKQFKTIDSTYQRINSLKVKYEIKKLEEILQKIPEQSSLHQSLDQWIARENKRCEFLNVARQNHDIESMKKLLKGLDDSHPEFTDHQNWLVHEDAFRQQVVTSLSEFDLETAEKLIQSMDKAHPWHDELSNWAHQQHNTLQALADAKENYDVVQANNLIKPFNFSSTPKIYEPFVKWISDEKELRYQLKQFLESKDFGQIEMLMMNLPPAHPIYETLEKLIVKEQGLEHYLDLIQNSVSSEIEKQAWEKVFFFCDREVFFNSACADGYLQLQQDAMAKFCENVEGECIINKIDVCVEDHQWCSAAQLIDASVEFNKIKNETLVEIVQKIIPKINVALETADDSMKENQDDLKMMLGRLNAFVETNTAQVNLDVI